MKTLKTPRLSWRCIARCVERAPNGDLDAQRSEWIYNSSARVGVLCVNTPRPRQMQTQFDSFRCEIIVPGSAAGLSLSADVVCESLSKTTRDKRFILANGKEGRRACGVQLPTAHHIACYIEKLIHCDVRLIVIDELCIKALKLDTENL